MEEKVVRNPRFTIYKDFGGKWRWRLRARNGEIVGVGEGYESKQGAINGVRAVKKAAAAARYAVLPNGSTCKI